MRASAAQQQLLLPLAAVDHRIAHLQKVAHELQQPQPEVAALRRTAQPLRQAQLLAQRELEAQQREMSRLTDDLDTVAKRTKHDENLLAQATDSKVAQQITSELEQLAMRRDKLETQQLVVMEAIEGAEQKLQAAAAELQDITAKEQELLAEIAARLQQAEQDLAQLTKERKLLAAPITGELLAEYDAVRARGGIGAAALTDNVSGASGMHLTPGELAVVKSLDSDELYYCSLTGAILVRPETS